MRFKWLQNAAMLAVVVTAAVAAGCGSSSNDTSSGASGSKPTSTATTKADAQQAAAARLKDYYAGTDRALPSSSPKPQAGKNVWVISCASAAEGCAIPAAAIKDAGSKIGWKVTVFDGQFAPPVQSNGIRSAVADHADAIVMIAIDCQNVASAVKQAKASGAKLYGAFSLDCDETGGGQRMFNGWASLMPKRSQYSTYLREVRAVVGADWAIAKAGSDAHVLIVDQKDLLNGKIETEGFKARLASECPKCSVSTVEFTGADLLKGNLKNIVAAALAKDPTVNVVVAPYDASITLGIGPAVQQASRSGGRDIRLVGYEGLSANMKQIKGGGPDSFSSGFPSQWVGWQTVDELNRLFQGKPLVDEGLGFQAVDQDHNIPTETTFYDGNVDASGKPKQDYRANFLKIWGVG
jgi:ribose transport system substrate-binding protein